MKTSKKKSFLFIESGLESRTNVMIETFVGISNKHNKLTHWERRLQTLRERHTLGPV